MKKMIINIRQEYRSVRQSFFPRWDRGGLWKCRLDSGMVYYGICEFERKRIRVKPLSEKLRWLLIHEICHAVTRRCGHRGRFRSRLEQAGQRARELGDTALWRMIEQDLKATAPDPECVGERPSAKAIYNEIGDAVSFSRGPTVTFRQVVEFVASGYGVAANDLLKTYSAAGMKKAYRKAIGQRATRS